MTRLHGATLPGSLDNENGQGRLACSVAALCLRLCVARGRVKDVCVEHSVTPAVWPSSGPRKRDLSFPLPKYRVRTNGLEIVSCYFCYPQSYPAWISRSKNRTIYVVSSSPWAKVKGFALRASENPGLAGELNELSYSTAPMFQIQLLLILPYETFSKKRWNSSMGGAGHLFQASYLAAFLSIHISLVQGERNIGLPVKTFNSLHPFCGSLENNSKYQELQMKDQNKMQYLKRDLWAKVDEFNT